MLNEDRIAHYQTIFKEITVDDLQLLFSLTREKRLQAGDRYIEVGSSTHRLAYIKSGLMRAYDVNERGEEITVLIRWEDQFFANFDTILRNRPSRFFYEALEDTVVLEADYNEFMKVVDASPRFAVAKTHFLQFMLAEALERIEGFVLLSPEQRYLHLVNRKSNLTQRVSSKHLATMLGITPVSLSRIKKRIANRK